MPRACSPTPRRRSTRSWSTDSARTPGRAVTLLVTELREDGLRVERGYGDRSVKAQWKLADRSGAAFGVMLGRDEAERSAVAVKDLRTGEQVEVPRRAARGLAADDDGKQEERIHMMRTDRAGDLRASDIGRDVVVCGWVDARRDHGGVVFLDVRDVAGIVQVVVDPEQDPAAPTRTGCAASTSCGSVGAVRHRPEGTVNDVARHRRGRGRGDRARGR